MHLSQGGLPGSPLLYLRHTTIQLLCIVPEHTPPHSDLIYHDRLQTVSAETNVALILTGHSDFFFVDSEDTLGMFAFHVQTWTSFVSSGSLEKLGSLTKIPFRVADVDIQGPVVGSPRPSPWRWDQ